MAWDVMDCWGAGIGNKAAGVPGVATGTLEIETLTNTSKVMVKDMVSPFASVRGRVPPWLSAAWISTVAEWIPAGAFIIGVMSKDTVPGVVTLAIVVAAGRLKGWVSGVFCPVCKKLMLKLGVWLVTTRERVLTGALWVFSRMMFVLL